MNTKNNEHRNALDNMKADQANHEQPIKLSIAPKKRKLEVTAVSSFSDLT